MNLGLPLPTPLNSWVLPDGWHSTYETFRRVSWGRNGIARCGHVNTDLQKLCMLLTLPGASHSARPESTQTGWDEDQGPAGFHHCKVLIVY